MKKILLKSLLLLMLLACKKEVKNDTKHISDDFAELLTNYNEEGYLLNPISATKAGDNRFNDQFPNFLSEDYIQLSLGSSFIFVLITLIYYIKFYLILTNLFYINK